MANINLRNLDLFALVDRSGSMGDPVKAGSGVRRWDATGEVAKCFVQDLGKEDEDGIDMAFFSGRFDTAEGVTPDSFVTVWNGQRPGGGTNAAPPLKWALDKAATRYHEKNQLVVVFTDGQANDEADVVRVIIEASQKMSKDEQLAILFVQVGDDPAATAYLQRLDDKLQTEGAKFDIVDVCKLDDIEGMTLQQVVDKAFND